MRRVGFFIILTGLLVAAAPAWAGDCDALSPKAPEGSYEWEKQYLFHAACADKVEAGSGWKAVNLLDRADKPVSELLRAIYVAQCLEKNWRGDKPMDKQLGSYNNCGVDARKLDWAKVEAEAKALNMPASGLKNIKEMFNEAKALADKFTAYAKNLAKGNAMYGKLFFDIPEQAFADWNKTYQANKALFDLAYAVEDKVFAVPFAQRDSANKIGCEELRTGYRAYIIGTKPKTKQDVRSAAVDLVGHPVLQRLVACDALEGRYIDAAGERTMMSRQRYFQGPRAAAHWAVMEHAATIKTFGEHFVGTGKVTPDFETDELIRITNMVIDEKVRNLPVDDFDSLSDADRKKSLQGKVATLKKGKDGIQATFKAEKWEEPDWQCTKTGKIQMYESDGTPIWQSNCKVVGSHTESFSLGALTLTQGSIGALKVGQIAKILSPEMHKGDPASFVIEIDEPGKGKKPPTPVAYFGIPLK